MSRYRQREAKELVKRYLMARSVKPVTDPSTVRKDFEELQDALVYLVSLRDIGYPEIEERLRRDVSRLVDAKKAVGWLLAASNISQWFSATRPDFSFDKERFDKAEYLRMKIKVLLENAEALSAGRGAALGPGEWEWYLNSISSAAEDLALLLRGHIAKNPLPKPEHFTYRKIQVLNPEGIAGATVKMILDGVDYILDLFESKGMSKLLLTGLKRLVLLTKDPGCPSGDGCAAGHYFAGEREIRLYSEHMKMRAGRIFKRWIDEAFLHEFGHMVHLDYLTPEAKAYWDAAWEKVERKWIISPDDRKRFLELLRRSRGSVAAVTKKLSPEDRVKWRGMLLSVSWTSGLKRIRLNKTGRRWTDFLKDPEGEAAKSVQRQYLDPVTVTREMVSDEVVRLNRLLETRLGLGSKVSGDWNLPSELDDLLKSERKEALREELGFPTDYAETNVKEDFAENFVEFITHPERMPEKRLHRMKRTLWLSGFGGKGVVRLARARRLAMNWMLRGATRAS